ncbi:MAG: bifunctional sugar-1-phosphate nucleotidylyltransferase/acetyltransferase [Thermoplasmatota archaeon]
MKAIVLAAGRGTRMGPLTAKRPKPLLPIAGRPMLLRLLDTLREVEVREAVVVVYHEAGQVRAAVTDAPEGLAVTCVDQGDPQGTGHAVAVAAEALGAAPDEEVLLIMGDCLVSRADLKDLVAAPGFTLGAHRVDDPTQYGALDVAGDRVQALAEKSPTPPSDLVNTGLYKVPGAALAEAADLKPSPRGELEFTDIVNAWGARGDVGWIAMDSWLDVGSPWDLLAAQEQALPRILDRQLGKSGMGGPGTIEDGVHVHGRLWVEEGAIVRSGVYVQGDVWVGAGAKVGPNSYLRGATCIGAGSHVGAATEIKNSLLLDHANAPHLNYVGDSVLGSHTNLGAGTKVANLKVTPGTVKVDWQAKGNNSRVDTGRRKFGVIVGDGTKTGINCSLNPGTIVGADVLVGAGQVVAGWVPDGSRVL